ncbi:MAG TPA: AsmA family protein [Herminiimonas sp.]|nr:AsmA family protein [Herminiimonas sp.]
MRRWKKGVLWGAAGLALVLTAGAVALQLLVNDTQLKSIAQEKVQQAWGRQLDIKTLTWDVFPYLELHGTGVTVSNADWAQDKHFLDVDAVTARLAFMPLLTGKVVVKRLDFNGLKANLEVSADGKRNWDVPHTGNNEPSAQRLPEILQQVELTTLRIKDASIIYREAKNPSIEWQVSSVRVDAGSGLHNVSFSANVEREGNPLQLNGKLDDLSQLGAPDAQTKGSINAKFGQASVALQGTLPLSLAPRHYDFNAAVDAKSMKEAFGFFNLKQGLPAAFKTSATVQGTDAGIAVKDFKLQLGKLTASGEGQWDSSGKKPAFNVRLQADHVDMIQTFIDAGRPPLPPKPDGELFRDNPLPWQLLSALDGTQGKLDLHIESLKLRSGIEVTDAVAKANFDGDRMNVSTFSGSLLSGSTAGNAVLEGRQKTVQLNLQLHNTQLGLWFKATGKKVDISGGPMEVDARITAHGNSMKDLAASVSGPIDVRIGSAKILSPKAGHSEFWMTGLFSSKEADQIDLACVSAHLPFQSGIAKGEGIAGARSDVSQLLTSGAVDMRRQELDLHGRVRARSGVNLGISTFASEVKIVGKLVKPRLNLDEAGVGGAIARIGAAILTSGVSIIATSIWDGANPASDPCQIVFSGKVVARRGSAP